MSTKKLMKILILEDDEFECTRFKNSINKRDDIRLVFATNSCKEAISLLKSDNIEGVIVDIDLHGGTGGTGLDFLKDLKSLNLDIKPVVIITTNITSKRVYSTIRKLDGDLILCKGQIDYCPEIVLNNLLLLRDSLGYGFSDNLIKDTNLETEEERKNRISSKINSELDLIGMSHHLKGRNYIFEAIYYLVEKNNDDLYYLQYLIDKYKKVGSSISSAMQSSINNAWRNTPYEELEKYFTANISYRKGTPTPVEFIHYYVDKIKQAIK